VSRTALGQCLKELGPWPYEATKTKTKPGVKVILLAKDLRDAEAERVRSALLALLAIPAGDRDNSAQGRRSLPHFINYRINYRAKSAFEAQQHGAAAEELVPVTGQIDIFAISRRMCCRTSLSRWDQN
jgi:hypothetical protein